MKFLSIGSSSLFRFVCLVAALLCFTIASNAQFGGVGSTGGPILDWEDDYVCWNINGIDSTLNRFRLFQAGLNNATPTETFYLDVYGDTINVTGGSLSFQACSNLIFTTDSLDYDLEQIPLCDYRQGNANPYSPYIRWYLKRINKITGVASTVNYFDTDYQGAPYTVTGIPSDGMCAELSDSITITDYEYERICMTDSIDAVTQIQYYRLWVFKDSTSSFVEVDIDLMPYTVVGKAKKCPDGNDFELKELCDVTYRDLDLAYNVNELGERINFSFTNPTIGFSPVRNMTFDCGQGQIFSDNLVPTCDCNYSGMPDGQYQITLVVDLVNGGTIVERLGFVNIDDGNIAYSVTSPATLNVSNIIYTNEPFFRKYYADDTYIDVDVDNNPYALSGTASRVCDNRDRFSDIYEQSTRPNLQILGSDECWEKTIDSTCNVTYTLSLYDNAVVPASPVTDIIGIEFNGGPNISTNMIPVLIPQGESQAEREHAVNTIQEVLIQEGYCFASVTSNDSTITIIGLPSSVTDIRFFVQDTPTADEYLSYSMGTYTGTETTFFYTVYRYAHDASTALVLNHFGEETYLPADAMRVRCNTGESEETCDIKADRPHVFNLTSGIHTYPANTLYSIDIRAYGAGVTVKMGGDPIAPYPLGYGNWYAPPGCDLLAYDIVIDVSAAGAEVMVSYLD